MPNQKDKKRQLQGESMEKILQDNVNASNTRYMGY